MRTGLRLFQFMIVLLALQIIANPIVAQTTHPATQPEDIDEALDRQIQAGLEFLARQQSVEGYIAGDGPRVALTGLSVMAFLADGHAPDVGPHGFTVRQAVDWLIEQVPADGYIGNVDGSRMYGQGIVTLALAEAYGVETDATRRARIRDAITRALMVILAAQQVAKDPVHAGGWRYEVSSADSDLSLSGWNSLVLRACRNIGFPVPDEAVGGASQYVLQCFRADQAGFSYQPGLDVSPAMTGVGVLSLQLLLPSAEDQPGRPKVQAAAATLAKTPVTDATRFSYYSHYYVTQAAFQIGGDVWKTVWSNTRAQLPRLQQPDGGWPASKTPEEPDRVYTTALSLLTLSVPYQLLPIYQR